MSPEGIVSAEDAVKDDLRIERFIQPIGRAARNADAKVHLYADKRTDSLDAALEETRRRRELPDRPGLRSLRGPADRRRLS